MELSYHRCVTARVAINYRACHCYRLNCYCNCNHILFTKLPWPGDSEGTFWSSSQAATCLPHTAEASHCPFICWTSSREAVNTNFYDLLFDPTVNRTRVYRFSSRRFIHSTTDRPLLLHRKARGVKLCNFHQNRSRRHERKMNFYKIFMCTSSHITNFVVQWTSI